LAILSVSAAILFTSCQKEEYYCSCKYQTGSAPAKRDYQIGYVANDKAQKQCNQIQLDLASYGAQCHVTF
jgi:hypothetical protein